MVCRVILEKAARLPSLMSVSALRSLRTVARAGAVLGLFAGTALAANYSATVEYTGQTLYYKVINESGSQTQSCRSAANGVTYSTSRISDKTFQFFTDNKCSNRAQLASIKGSELYEGNSTSVTLAIAANGTWTKSNAPAGPAAVSSSSAIAVNPGRPTVSSSSAAPNPGGAAAAGKKTVAFFTPWSNTNAILFMNGDSVGIMKSLKGYCGWYVASVTPPANGFNVYFKQTVGLNYVGAEGMVTAEPTTATEISLDSIAAMSDTIWIQGYKTDVPALFSKYPGVLGDCPLKKFPVTVFDWLHGDKGDGDGSGKNGDPANGVSADFGSGGCSGSNNGKGFMEGMVQKKLGTNGVPVPADPFPTACKMTTHLSSWFLPEVVAKDAQGNQYTNMTCRDIYISMDDQGFWLAEISGDGVSEGNDASRGGMFLVDDFEYLDDAKTVKNPYFDQLSGNNRAKHNFGFAVKIQATFEYVPGQYFDFYGDDDVWVFIDNRLAVDIGGQHRQVAGAVDLDTMNLVPGQTYDFHIFYVERHTSSSNFRMRTSIDLQVDASIFITSDGGVDVTNYEVWQVNKKNKLSCGNDRSDKDTTITGGPSTFRLTGGNLSEPQILEAGKVYYEGLAITSDTTFSVNVEAIKAGGALAPGHYFLEITLKSDISQTTKVEITIPQYDIPSVAFASEKWKVYGKEVSGDTLQIGDFAYATYQVNITFFEEWAQVNNYNKKINLSFSDVNIDILDTVGGKKISSVTLDSNGRATFYVHANVPVAGATLTAKGAAAGASVWTNLNFAEPDIPRVEYAVMVDRNGDGRGDSLYVKFDRLLSGKSKLDSIQFEFGEAFRTTTKFRQVTNTAIVAVAEEVSPDKCNGDVCGFGSRQFTGGATTVYTGSMNNWFTYKDNGKVSQFYKENEPISDGVGPIILRAVKTTNKDGVRQLALTFSEALDEKSMMQYASMFDFICMRSGVNEKPERPAQAAGADNSMVLVYNNSKDDVVLPTTGDQVRFFSDSTGSFAMDLVGNAAHMGNPWVTVTGDQDLGNESPGLIAIGEDPYGIIRKDTITQTLLITDNNQDVQQIGDSLGVQGNLIDYDISKIMLEETQKAVATLDAYIESRLGSTTTYDTTTTSISEAEALAQVFADIRAGVVGENFNFSEETVNAIMGGTITEANFRSVLSPAEQNIIANLTQANIEASTVTTVSVTDVSTVTQADLFQSIRDGKLDAELLAAGVDPTLIEAIKRGDINEFNIEDYRNGTLSMISEDDVKLFYRTRYYSQLGEYVGGASSYITCSDESVYGKGGCLQNRGKIFLAWNMRSDDGRLVGTGVYIARLELKMIVNGAIVMHQTRDKLWGVRRGKINPLVVGK